MRAAAVSWSLLGQRFLFSMSVCLPWSSSWRYLIWLGFLCACHVISPPVSLRLVNPLSTQTEQVFYQLYHLEKLSARPLHLLQFRPGGDKSSCKVTWRSLLPSLWGLCCLSLPETPVSFFLSASTCHCPENIPKLQSSMMVCHRFPLVCKLPAWVAGNFGQLCLWLFSAILSVLSIYHCCFWMLQAVSQSSKSPSLFLYDVLFLPHFLENFLNFTLQPL